MSEFKLPHVEDLRTDATLIRGLQEDFKAIEQEDIDIRKLINDKHDDLSKQLTQLNQRLDELMNGGAM
ncbi:hypothetical protein [Limosilactobacillus reuteri]|uniref:Uncharacterized protein n=1 Tax=Limosilactobacillus reuteri TaxID=1598 RepID=A0AAW8ZZ15_LIMRT|nr:hypothetical protein [Limosilactobacillus reuteri]MDV8945898.1 hypothetical protein [Limosilactobacillus reuteri]